MVLVYLPTFGLNYWVNVGKYSIHGAFGNFYRYSVLGGYIVTTKRVILE